MSKNKLFKYFVVAGLATAFLWIFFVFGKEVKKRWIVYVTLHSSHWEKRYKEMQQIRPGRYKTIFLGNSLTEMFYLGAYFNDTTLLNCGIVGDFTEGLLKRVSLITRLKPSKLFIEIGINDMIEQISLNEINTNYKQLIRIIQEESQSTKIYIQSNLPVIINRPSLLTSDEDVNNAVRKQNENLKKLAAETNCVYIDIYQEFSKEKDKESLFSWDGVHLTDKAYMIWSKKLKSYLSSDK